MNIVNIATITGPIKRSYAELDDIFTDKEAWDLFRLSAFLETFGWTFLIVGIFFSHFKWPGYGFVLPIAGSVHGLLYLIYVSIVFFAHRSLRWSTKRFIVAEIVSNVPYGALVFEQWVARQRRSK